MKLFEYAVYIMSITCMIILNSESPNWINDQIFFATCLICTLLFSIGKKLDRIHDKL